MKKILHVTRNFPPLVGGMEKLNFNIFDALRSHFDVSISGPKGSTVFHNASYCAEFSVRPLWLYLIASFFKTTRLAIKFKPDIVFCGSGAAILAGFFSAKVSGASLVCYLHGLDIIVDNKIYQWFFLPLIKKSDLILVNSNHTRSLAINSGIDASCIKIIPPGTVIPDISKKALLASEFRKKYGLEDTPFILIAGRITARKGVVEFVRNAMPGIVAAHPDLQLIVVGDEAVDAMKRSFGLKEAILNNIQELSLSENVKLVGTVDDAMLSAAFFSAELLIFPVLDIPNDIEGFGMVAIEAAAHGLPTVGFAVGGVVDAIAHGKSGWLIEPGNYSEMTRVILDAYSQRPSIQPSCIEYAEKFSWEHFEFRLENAMKGLCCEK